MSRNNNNGRIICQSSFGWHPTFLSLAGSTTFAWIALSLPHNSFVCSTAFDPLGSVTTNIKEPSQEHQIDIYGTTTNAVAGILANETLSMLIWPIETKDTPELHNMDLDTSKNIST